LIRAASVCSGIGGAELAFAGIASHAFMAETDPFARAVLVHRFPHIPLHGDFTKVEHDGPVDVLVGGTPCQSFSVAGLRGGMADERGNLALEFLRLADRLRAGWVLWENVPGVLSSNGGRDFGSFLGGLGELGYGWAYRSLDAQHFGLAQRRCRVFVVGCLGDWRRAASVLFEPASLRGHPAPRREAREGVANALTERADGGWRGDLDNDTYVAFDCKAGAKARPVEVAQPVMAAGPRSGDQGGDVIVTHALRAASEDGTGRGTPLVAAFHQNQRSEVTTNYTTGALNSGGGKPGQGYPAALIGSGVRRLTPAECERLQGFPDGWTAITYRGKPAADGNRYRALGNAFAVPVVRWIARRLAREHFAGVTLAEVAD
jgi:DNA (cytosine-5)-methyltransferase 1